MNRIHLILLIHAHQPVGNFDHVFEHVYQQSYLPFLDCLERHSRVRVGLHYSGPLLEWLDARHPDYIDRVARAAASGQVEIVGGGFYEPILISIPRHDQIEQIVRMRDWLTKRIGKSPSGAWLAERVWEPQLPEALQAAGVKYTLLDDVHFLSAGFQPDQLHGYYLAEEQCSTVKVLPGLKAMRYMVPFRQVEETIGFLRHAAERNVDGMVAMGDDMEKFGGWPGTHDHCYRNGWLDRFFAAVEENSEWLLPTPPGEYTESHPPLGRADLPTASYTEMMEWVLPTGARKKLHEIEGEFGSREDVQRFLRGGVWRGFMSKYGEVNLLHKKALHVSRELTLRQKRKAGARSSELAARARTHLLRAQCNDAYWHGVFGGLYSPHLRTECWRELIRAESLMNGIRSRRGSVEIKKFDFDADGCDEVYASSREFAALIKPDDGATVAMLDFRPTAIAAVNSLQRRPEAYHSRLAEAAHSQGGRVASIHDQVRVKESGLEKLLRYDKWPRHCFRVFVFPEDKTLSDCAAVTLEESSTIAGGRYEIDLTSKGEVRCQIASGKSAADAGLHVEKIFSFASGDDRATIRCRIKLSQDGSQPVRSCCGVENVINLLAPNAPDRYFETSEGRQAMNWSGVTRGETVRAVDQWQNFSAEISAPGAEETWIVPIETVSESEEGFERVYQGSQIMPVWRAEIPAAGEWSCEISLEMRKAHA